MDIIQRTELLKEVLEGKRPQVDLKSELDDSNWLPTAFEYAVSERLRGITTGAQQFRLKLTTKVPTGEQEDFTTEVIDLDGRRPVKAKRPVLTDKIEHTEWQPELSRMHAPTFMSQMRVKYPKAAISIERQ